MTDAQALLDASEACYQQAASTLLDARRQREAAIRAAADSGMSTRQIAQHLTLTAQRVQQIIAGR
jgi:uncharacterized protein (UPF0548 family)